MATFILVCFVVFILAFIAKLIYDVQQNKKSIKIQQHEITADEVNAFQTLAGIKPHNPQKGTNELVDAMLNAEKLKEEFKNVEFPAPDPSIPVITAKITTIDTKSYGDSDPLASVPMSRVSKEAKQKMAEIAKQDISDRLEAQSEIVKEIIAAPSNWPSENDQRLGMEFVKPKAKKKNPKQFGPVDESVPFKKTRKKSTKTKTNGNESII